MQQNTTFGSPELDFFLDVLRESGVTRKMKSCDVVTNRRSEPRFGLNLALTIRELDENRNPISEATEYEAWDFSVEGMSFVGAQPLSQGSKVAVHLRYGDSELDMFAVVRHCSQAREEYCVGVSFVE